MAGRPPDHAAQRDITVEIRQAVRDADGGGDLQRTGAPRSPRGPRPPAPARPWPPKAVPRRWRCNRARSRSRSSPACRRTEAPCRVGMSGHLSKLRNLARARDGPAIGLQPHDLGLGELVSRIISPTPSTTGSARRAHTGAASGGLTLSPTASFIVRLAQQAPAPRAPPAAISRMASPELGRAPLGPAPTTSSSGSIACILTSTGSGPVISPFTSTYARHLASRRYRSASSSRRRTRW